MPQRPRFSRASRGQLPLPAEFSQPIKSFSRDTPSAGYAGRRRSDCRDTFDMAPPRAGRFISMIAAVLQID